MVFDDGIYDAITNGSLNGFEMGVGAGARNAQAVVRQKFSAMILADEFAEIRRKKIIVVPIERNANVRTFVVVCNDSTISNDRKRFAIKPGFRNVEFEGFVFGEI